MGGWRKLHIVFQVFKRCVNKIKDDVTGRKRSILLGNEKYIYFSQRHQREDYFGEVRIDEKIILK
jgi:hypothetical protein